jgi:Tfp pilus assembly protein PilF
MTALARLGALGAVVVLLAACTGPEAEVARTESAQAHYDIGLGALAENNLPKAISELQLAVQENPRLARHHHALGNAYLRNRQFDQAIAALRRATELDPRLSDAFNDLGIAYTQKQQWEPAVEAFRRALANPHYISPDRAYLNLGNVYYMQGNYDLASQQFRKLLDIIPQSPDGHFFLGRTLLAQRKYPEAREEFEEAIKLDGTIAVFHLELGKALMAEGRRADARESFRRTLSISPAGPEADEARRHLRELN